MTAAFGPDIYTEAEGSDDTLSNLGPLRTMAGIFEGLPCALEEVSMLGVHDGGIARAEAKEAGVEHGDVVKDGGALDVVRAGKFLGRCTGGEELLIGEGTNGFDAIAEVEPEVADVPRTGEAPGHSDNRDCRGLHIDPVKCCEPFGGVLRGLRPE